MNRQHGFTLIELMIVVAIIAILAAIAISQYQDYVIRSQIAEGGSLIDGVKSAVGEFQNNHGYFAASNASYGIATATSVTGKYVSRLDVADGVITATFSSNAPQESNVDINGQTLSYSPITHAGSIEWVCNRSNALKEKWVPAVCRH